MKLLTDASVNAAPLARLLFEGTGKHRPTNSTTQLHATKEYIKTFDPIHDAGFGVTEMTVLVDNIF
jgi:hypothetical protein